MGPRYSAFVDIFVLGGFGVMIMVASVNAETRIGMFIVLLIGAALIGIGMFIGLMRLQNIDNGDDDDIGE